MREPLQSVKGLIKDFFISILSGLAGAGITGVLTSKVFGALFLVGFVATSVCYLLFHKYRRLYKFIRAGGAGYYFSFDLGLNEEVLSGVKERLCYLGISAGSILEYVKKWVNSSPTIEEYRFLLMDPESPNLKRQVAFEKGVAIETALETVNSRLSARIEEEAEAARSAIHSSIKALKNLSIYQDGKLKIRLFREFTPCWMYILDDSTIYVGILEKGKRGQDSPVMLFTKLANFASPYDAFKNSWDYLWANSEEV